MPRVDFVQANGSTVTVDAWIGGSLMEAAVSRGVEGIDALCGGACCCATCHIYVGETWLGVVGPAGGDEGALLDSTDLRRPDSRLACQIRVCEEIHGMRVAVAPRAD